MLVRRLFLLFGTLASIAQAALTVAAPASLVMRWGRSGSSSSTQLVQFDVFESAANSVAAQQQIRISLTTPNPELLGVDASVTVDLSKGSRWSTTIAYLRPGKTSLVFSTPNGAILSTVAIELVAPSLVLTLTAPLVVEPDLLGRSVTAELSDTPPEPLLCTASGSASLALSPSSFTLSDTAVAVALRNLAADRAATATVQCTSATSKPFASLTATLSISCPDPSVSLRNASSANTVLPFRATDFLFLRTALSHRALADGESVNATFTIIPATVAGFSPSSSSSVSTTSASKTLTFTNSTWLTEQPLRLSWLSAGSFAFSVVFSSSLASIGRYSGVAFTSQLFTAGKPEFVVSTASSAPSELTLRQSLVVSLRLSGPPMANFSVAVTRSIPAVIDLSASADTLAFSPDDWQTERSFSVTNSAASSDRITLTLAAAGPTLSTSGYSGVASSFPIQLRAPRLVFSQVPVIARASQSTWTVEISLEVRPSAAVLLALEIAPALPSGSKLPATALSFSPSNYNVPQTLSIPAALGGYQLTLSPNTDSDYRLSTTRLPLFKQPESGFIFSFAAGGIVRLNGPEAISVSLPLQPVGDVTVTVAVTGASDAVALSTTKLVFTAANFQTRQSVGVAFGRGPADLTVTFRAMGGGYDDLVGTTKLTVLKAPELVLNTTYVSMFIPGPGTPATFAPQFSSPALTVLITDIVSQTLPATVSFSCAIKDKFTFSPQSITFGPGIRTSEAVIRVSSNPNNAAVATGTYSCSAVAAGTEHSGLIAYFDIHVGVPSIVFSISPQIYENEFTTLSLALGAKPQSPVSVRVQFQKGSVALTRRNRIAIQSNTYDTPVSEPVIADAKARGGTSDSLVLTVEGAGYPDGIVATVQLSIVAFPPTCLTNCTNGLGTCVDFVCQCPVSMGQRSLDCGTSDSDETPDPAPLFEPVNNFETIEETLQPRAILRYSIHVFATTKAVNAKVALPQGLGENATLAIILSRSSEPVIPRLIIDRSEFGFAAEIGLDMSQLSSSSKVYLVSQSTAMSSAATARFSAQQADASTEPTSSSSSSSDQATLVQVAKLSGDSNTLSTRLVVSHGKSEGSSDVFITIINMGKFAVSPAGEGSAQLRSGATAITIQPVLQDALADALTIILSVGLFVFVIVLGILAILYHNKKYKNRIHRLVLYGMPEFEKTEDYYLPKKRRSTHRRPANGNSTTSSHKSGAESGDDERDIPARQFGDGGDEDDDKTAMLATTKLATADDIHNPLRNPYLFQQQAEFDQNPALRMHMQMNQHESMAPMQAPDLMHRTGHSRLPPIRNQAQIGGDIADQPDESQLQDHPHSFHPHPFGVPRPLGSGDNFFDGTNTGLTNTMSNVQMNTMPLPSISKDHMRAIVDPSADDPTRRKRRESIEQQQSRMYMSGMESRSLAEMQAAELAMAHDRAVQLLRLKAKITRRQVQRRIGTSPSAAAAALGEGLGENVDSGDSAVGSAANAVVVHEPGFCASFSAGVTAARTSLRNTGSNILKFVMRIKDIGIGAYLFVIVLNIVAYLLQLLRVLFNVAVIYSALLTTGIHLPDLSKIRHAIHEVFGDYARYCTGLIDLLTKLNFLRDISWCGGSLALIVPYALLVAALLFRILLGKDLILMAGISMNRYKIGAGWIKQLAISALSRMLVTVILISLQAIVDLLSRLVVAAFLMDETCSPADYWAKICGRVFIIVALVLFLAFNWTLFTGVPAERTIVGYGRGAVRLVLLTFGVWTNDNTLSYGIRERSYLFDKNPDDSDDQQEMVASSTARSRTLVFAAIPLGIIVNKFCEAMNNPPLINTSTPQRDPEHPGELLFGGLPLLYFYSPLWQRFILLLMHVAQFAFTLAFVFLAEKWCIIVIALTIVPEALVHTGEGFLRVAKTLAKKN